MFGLDGKETLHITLISSHDLFSRDADIGSCWHPIVLFRQSWEKMLFRDAPLIIYKNSIHLQTILISSSKVYLKLWFSTLQGNEETK